MREITKMKWLIENRNGDYVQYEVIDPSQINLNSFQPKPELNPKFFPDGNKLLKRTRLRLLEVADDFIDELNLPFAEPKDIHIVGSIVGYNWSKYSDVDLHIIYDFNDIDKRTHFVREYMDSKKTIWNENKKIRIYGYDVELYVEDIHEAAESNGRYSLESNEWIQMPEHPEPLTYQKAFIKEKSAKLINLIDKYEELFNEISDDGNDEQMLTLAQKCNKLWTKIKGMRKFGIARGSESDPLNIIFKVLRRTERLEKLADLKNRLYIYNKSLGNSPRKHNGINLANTKKNINFASNLESIQDSNKSANHLIKESMMTAKEYREYRENDLTNLKENDFSDLMEYIRLNSKQTGLPVDILVDEWASYKSENHPLWIYFKNNYQDSCYDNWDSVLPITISENPKIPIKDYKLKISKSDLNKIMNFIVLNLDILRDLADEKIKNYEFEKMFKPINRMNESLLVEMAKIFPEVSGLDVILWLDQEHTYMAGKHAPRIKFQAMSGNTKSDTFASMLISNPDEIFNMPKDANISSQSINKIKEWVLSNQENLFKLSNKEINRDEFLTAMKVYRKKIEPINIIPPIVNK